MKYEFVCAATRLTWYRDSDAVLRSIDELQSQLREVRAHLGSQGLQREVGAVQPISDAIQAKPSPQLSLPDSQNTYAGPTSSTYSLSAADSRLSTIREPSQTQGSLPSGLSTSPGSLPTAESPEVNLGSSDQHSHQVSIGSLTLEDAESCIDTFQAVFDVLHPIPTLANIRGQAAQLLRATRRSLRSQPTRAGDCGLVEMFKIVVAIGMVCNHGSSTPLSRALYQSLEPLIGDAVFARTISHDFRTLLLLIVSRVLYEFSATD